MNKARTFEAKDMLLLLSVLRTFVHVDEGLVSSNCKKEKTRHANCADAELMK